MPSNLYCREAGRLSQRPERQSEPDTEKYIADKRTEERHERLDGASHDELARAAGLGGGNAEQAQSRFFDIHDDLL